MRTTIADDFSGTAVVGSGYADFFAGVIEVAGEGEPNERTGEALRCYVRDFLKTCDTTQFCKAPGEPYSRIYLGRDRATGWEAIMMCWGKGSATTIHGHPGFAAYNFADGLFRMELFEFDADNGLQATGSVDIADGEGFFAIGRPDTFDNHIHRITCLSDTGHSLHIYCGDALKGVVFAEEK